MRLWEVTEVPRPHRRHSLHWTYRSAVRAAVKADGYYAARMRTLPKWTRPLHRFVRW